jgi:hypothetical protein
MPTATSTRATIKNDLHQSHATYLDNAVDSMAMLENAAVLLTDAATTLTLAAHAGKTCVIPNVSADRVFTLPTPTAAGQHIHLIGIPGAADGHDISIATGSDNTVFYTGTIVHHDTDLTGQTSACVFADGDSTSLMKLDLPEGFDLHFLSSSTTNWYIWGWASSATKITIADQ